MIRNQICRISKLTRFLDSRFDSSDSQLILTNQIKIYISRENILRASTKIYMKNSGCLIPDSAITCIDFASDFHLIPETINVIRNRGGPFASFRGAKYQCPANLKSHTKLLEFEKSLNKKDINF